MDVLGIEIIVLLVDLVRTIPNTLPLTSPFSGVDGTQTAFVLESFYDLFEASLSLSPSCIRLAVPNENIS